MEKIEQLFKIFNDKLDKFTLMADYLNVMSCYADHLDKPEFLRFETRYLQESRIFGVSSERLFGHDQFVAEAWLLNNLFSSLFTETDGLIRDLFRDHSLSNENEFLSTFFTTNFHNYLIIKAPNEFNGYHPPATFYIKYIFKENIQKISNIEPNNNSWIEYNFIFRKLRNTFVHLSFLEGEKAKKDYWDNKTNEIDESLKRLIQAGLGYGNIQNNYKEYKNSCTKDLLIKLHTTILDFTKLLQSLLTEISNSNIEYEKY